MPAHPLVRAPARVHGELPRPRATTSPASTVIATTTVRGGVKARWPPGPGEQCDLPLPTPAADLWAGAPSLTGEARAPPYAFREHTKGHYDLAAVHSLDKVGGRALATPAPPPPRQLVTTARHHGGAARRWPSRC